MKQAKQQRQNYDITDYTRKQNSSAIGRGHRSTHNSLPHHSQQRAEGMKGIREVVI